MVLKHKIRYRFTKQQNFFSFLYTLGPRGSKEGFKASKKYWVPHSQGAFVKLRKMYTKRK